MQEEQETSKSKETMEKIIQAGRYVLNQKDYYEAVVEEIAAVAGIAKATVFFYFKTKENLFKQILYSLIKDIYILIEKILNE
ncbi:MAG: TetR/AcrR family transcriptional regulator [Endomicrobia bacterium]|nr:TetR/AcrR family transcriptional regulator [Endomicrobiia bacterium]